MTIVRKYGDGVATCSHCGGRDLKLLKGTRITGATDRKRRFKHKYVNGEGKSWYGARCPACYASQESKRKGCLPRELQTAPRLIKGFRSEVLVVDHLKRSGRYAEVIHLGGIGQPDILARIGGNTITIEVKSATQRISKKGKVGYAINSITPQELKTADVYALVFPDDTIVLVESWIAGFRETPPKNSDVTWAKGGAKK